MTTSGVTQYGTVAPGDKAKHREALEAIVGMIQAKIEAGAVASIAVLVVGNEKGTKTQCLQRFLVRPDHIDLIDDGYQQMRKYLEERHGKTVAQCRAERQAAIAKAQGDAQ